MREFGFAEADIVTKWNQIVGPSLGRRTVPIRLAYQRGKRTGGNLHILAESAFALELQHTETLLIERVNGYYGYAAVERLTIHQGPLPPENKSSAAADPQLSPKDQKSLDSMLDSSGDVDLKAALERLGRRILASEKEKEGRS